MTKARIFGIFGLLIVMLAIFVGCNELEQAPHLEFNEAWGIFAQSDWQIPENYYPVGISSELAADVFDGINLNFNAIATFDENGLLWGIYAPEARFEEMGVLVKIGEISFSTFFAFEGMSPATSVVHGIEITAFYIPYQNFGEHFDEHSLRANFHLNGVPYSIIHNSQNLEQGKIRLAEMVEMFVLNKPNLDILTHN